MYSDQDTPKGGLPHSEIPGSKPAHGFPGLIAACHVLHRLHVPRHPPNALQTLEISLELSTHAQGMTLRPHGRTHSQSTAEVHALLLQRFQNPGRTRAQKRRSACYIIERDHPSARTWQKTVLPFAAHELPASGHRQTHRVQPSSQCQKSPIFRSCRPSGRRTAEAEDHVDDWPVSLSVPPGAEHSQAP